MPGGIARGMSIQANKLKAQIRKLEEKCTKQRELLDEVLACGHNSDCPAGVSDKYRCRCHYSIITEGLAKLDE